MFKPSRSRTGACRLSQPPRLRLLRPYSHVSIQRRSRRPAFFSLATDRTHKTSATQLTNKDLRRSATHAPLTPAHIETIPEVAAFTSPFENARPDSVLVADDKNTITRKQIAGLDATITTVDAEASTFARHGLGRWVIWTGRAEESARKSPYIASLDTGDGYSGRSKDARGKTSRALATPSKNSTLSLALDYTERLHYDAGNGSLERRQEIFNTLKSVFTIGRLNRLHARGYDVDDVASWGWILASDTADMAILRLHAFATQGRPANDELRVKDVPYFMFSIILRSRHLNAPGLASLLQLLQAKAPRQSASVDSLPDITTAMILLVRLIRHARIVAPEQMISIADLTERYLKDYSGVNPSSTALIRQITHNYNRLLSLFSVASSQHPFRAVSFQQQAQFKLIRQMASVAPPLPVTREGYQALAKVQLMHKKTPAEKEWARTQAQSWPPWREDKLGISQDVDYPGAQSRAADVLRRQTEAGYLQTVWDRAASVLAGWDTDKSPTVQSRRVLNKAPLTWLKGLRRKSNQHDGDGANTSEIDTELWTSRINATRTIREAWACFCAYDASSPAERPQGPYHAMLEKLAPRLQPTSPSSEAFPGDGREIQPSSTPAEDHLHIPVEPPGFHSFYQRMLQDGVKPAGKLVRLMLDHARTRREGVGYVNDSRLSEVKKDLLLNAHKYDMQVIRSTLPTFQANTLASFFCMIWRCAGGRYSGARTWHHPASHAVSDHAQLSWPTTPERITGEAYCLELLDIVPVAPQIYNKLVHTMLQILKTKGSNAAHAGNTWKYILDVLACMEKWDRKPDMYTFHSVASVVEHVIDTDADVNFELSCSTAGLRVRKTGHGNKGQTLAKQLFAQAVGAAISHSRLLTTQDSPQPVLSTHGWLSKNPETRLVEAPPPQALHLMMRILAKSGDLGSVLALLQWMDRFSNGLVAVSNELANGHRQMRFALCVAAMAMEDLQTAQPHENALVKARLLIEKNPAWGGWPKDDELERYLLTGRHPLRMRE